MAVPLVVFPYTCNERPFDNRLMEGKAIERGFKFELLTREKKWRYKLYNREGAFKFRNFCQMDAFFHGFDAAKVLKQVKEEKKLRSAAFEDLISKKIGVES